MKTEKHRNVSACFPKDLTRSKTKKKKKGNFKFLTVKFKNFLNSEIFLIVLLKYFFHFLAMTKMHKAYLKQRHELMCLYGINCIEGQIEFP